MIFIKKTIRSMLANKKSYIACIVLISIGIFIYVSMGIASYSLDVSKDIYYKEYNFPDVFASVKNIPQSEVDSITKINGIEKVNGRLVYDSRVLLDNSDDIITLRLATSKALKSDLNDIYLVSGTYLADPNDIMVSEDFLAAHNIKIGDSIDLNISGRKFTFNICASVQSPEYIYAIKDAKTVLPDAKTFSFAYIKEETLAFATGKQGLYNDIIFKLEPNFTLDDIKIEFEDYLERYGLISLYDREKHISYSILKTEIKSNKSMVTAVPSVFIIMSMAILYLMLKRVIEQDRMQIGTLKAFGYSNYKIMSNYILYGIITGFLGGILGVIMGYIVSNNFVDLYKQYYRIPILTRLFSVQYIAGGMAMAIFGGIFGAFMGSRSILKLSPYDAMRSKSPNPIKNDIITKFPFIKIFLTSKGCMSVRSIQRNSFRSFFIVIGIMFSYGMMTFMGSYGSLIDSLLLDQYTKIQVYDVSGKFNSPVDYDSAVKDVSAIKSVTKAEALFEVPVTLQYKNLKTAINIIGLDENVTLYKIYDSKKFKNLKPPKEGIIISNALANSLHAKRGDELTIVSSYSDKEQKIIVWDVVTQNLGSSCYMEAGALAKFFNTKKVATSFILNSNDVGYVRNILIDGKNISSVENTSKTVETYRTMLASYTGIITIMQIMSIVVAFAIIYNTSVISVSERQREFATIRVLGLQINEVSEIMSFEYWILCFIGIALGVPFSIFLKIQMAAAISADMFTIPTYIPIEAFAFGLFGCICAVFISNFTASKSIKSFDMVEVLKERE